VTAPAIASTQKLVGTLPKGTDLEVHVRSLSSDGEEFIDVREYVPSSETYGRGLLVPAAQAKALAKLLREA
jgi:hypothetical protein